MTHRRDLQSLRPETVLTLNEAADYLGMEAAELKKRTEKGYGPRVTNPSFKQADLDAWIEEMLGHA
jgi:hypothetical protein